MDKLTKRLRTSLLENPSIQIKETAVWYLPVMILDVEFKRVKRSKMDILMKMMMLTFEEADIRRPANLTEMLLVEELFIADLIEKMQRTGLIQQERGIYKLTRKGHEQLQTGIIEEELEEEWTELFYSSDLDEYWSELHQPEKESEQEEPIFRYADQQGIVNVDQILQFISERENGLDEDGFQTVVDAVLNIEERSFEYIPCVEFQLYNQEQDSFFARVWNTSLERWDEALENKIEEQERVRWREKYDL